ncbi:MAG: DUF2924 domain-containing protein [Candidatus Omnitrophica bacterium]|nr:DUF2924 domain-containing protein [Candidatus Omnitrophota bacterium]
MNETKLSQIMELKNKPLTELQAKYEELFDGQKPTSNNKVFIWRKIAYRIQELEIGGISNETQTRIDELIEQYDPVNNKSLRPEEQNQPQKKTKKSRRDFRLPIPGTVITKQYKDKSLEVKILETGFEYNNKVYKTLSAIAQEVTGAHWNGYLFFNL